MKIRKFIIIIFFLNISLNLYANNSELNKKFLPLKDFLILKFDLFFKDSIDNVFRGGGVMGIAYQEIDYGITFNDNDEINIVINAIMNKERYSSKRYYPKLKDCNQVRNKLIVNRYGYSFLKQKFNNLVNTENLSNSINEKVLNISSIDHNLKKKILEKIEIKINIIHPKLEKNISCGGKVIDAKLEQK